MQQVLFWKEMICMPLDISYMFYMNLIRIWLEVNALMKDDKYHS